MRIMTTAGTGEPPKIETIVRHEAAKSIISRNKSPDISFDQSINTYRGCEHGCIYCYARPTTPMSASLPASISRAASL